MWPWPPRRSRPGSSRRRPGFGRRRSSWGWPWPGSGSASPACSCARRAGMSRSSRAPPTQRGRRPARPGWRRSSAGPPFGDRRLFAASQAGLVNNLNDGMAWGLLPLFFASRGLPVVEIAVLAATYPAVWGVLQIGTGAWSDRVGRRPLIVLGMLMQAAAIGVIASGRVRHVAPRGGRPGRRDGVGLSDAHRRGRRCRRAVLASLGDRGLPAVARPGLRGRAPSSAASSRTPPGCPRRSGSWPC